VRQKLRLIPQNKSKVTNKGTILVPVGGVLIFYTVRYIIRVCRGSLNYPY